MRRHEAIAFLALAVLLITAGLAWLLGALGLVAAGAGLLSLTLFGFDVEGQRGETVARTRRRS